MFSDVHNGVGQTQKIIKDRRGGHRTSHHILFRIRGGDTAQENYLRCSQWGEANAENSKIEGGTLHKKQSRLLGGWLTV